MRLLRAPCSRPRKTTTRSERIEEFVRLSTATPTKTSTLLRVAVELRASGRADEAERWTDFARRSNPGEFARRTTPTVVERGVSDCNPTVRALPAIYAWGTSETGVACRVIDVPSDGRYTLAYKAMDKANGTWTYKYALHNLNSDRPGSRSARPSRRA